MITWMDPMYATFKTLSYINNCIPMFSLSRKTFLYGYANIYTEEKDGSFPSCLGVTHSKRQDASGPFLSI